MSTDIKKPAGQNGALRRISRFLTNVLLFLASPFIALSYLVAIPVVGFYQFTKAAFSRKSDGDKTASTDSAAGKE